MKVETVELNWKSPEAPRLHEIIGNEYAKRAIEVALSGSHELVILSFVQSPASDMLRAAARIASKNGIPFKGSVVPICECGGYGDPRQECSCSAADLKKYARKVLPIIKRAQIVVEVTSPRANETTRGNEPEANMVARILAARPRMINTHSMSSDSEELMRQAILTVKCTRQTVEAVAATIAKLDCIDRIHVQHVSEAIQYQHRHPCLVGLEYLH
jgi:magnesium chelatase family protein